jgi:hypothetical protein
MTRVMREPDHVRQTPTPRYLRWVADLKAVKKLAVQKTQWGPDQDRDGYPMAHSLGLRGSYDVANIQDTGRVLTCELISKLK